MKIISKNRKALHDYFILEKLEAGVSLQGTEVKSVRLGHINIKDSWCSFKNGEMFANNVHISPYEKGNIFNVDPKRSKKLLVHKKEALQLYGQYKQTGLSIVVLSVYLVKKYIKFEIALCKGKKQYDKRASKAKQESERKIKRAIKERLKMNR